MFAGNQSKTVRRLSVSHTKELFAPQLQIVFAGELKSSVCCFFAVEVEEKQVAEPIGFQVF